MLFINRRVGGLEKNWKKYRILLTKVDTNNTEIKLPAEPAISF